MKKKDTVILFNTEFNKKYLKILKFCLRWYWVGLLILLLFFFKDMFNFGLIVAMVIIGGLSQFYKMFLPLPVGLELMTLASVTILFWTNPAIAMLCTIIMILMIGVTTGRVSHYLFIKTAAALATLLIVSFFTPLGIVFVGKMTAILVNVFYLFLASFIDPKAWFVSYAYVLNIIFNWFLFSWFGEFVVNLRIG